MQQHHRPQMGPFAGAPGPLPRRGGPGQMMPNPQAGPTQQQIVAQQQAHEMLMRKKEQVISRSKLPVDRDLPEGLDSIAIGEGVQQYEKMRELERRLDAMMMRKRLDIRDSVYRDGKQNRTLRIWISNTAKNQPWQYQADMGAGGYDYNSGNEASFRVKIEGRLLEEGVEGDKSAEDEAQEQAEDGVADEDTAVETSDERPQKRQKMSTTTSASSSLSQNKLSHFFKSITIDFDRAQSLQPENYARIEWKRPEHAGNTGGELPKEADFDRLEFERKADENINITISLVKDEYPERYIIADPLAQLLDMKEGGRTEILMGVWEYIKSAGVRMDEDKKHIHCDHRLQSIFGSETIFFPHLPNLIRPFLSDPPPVVIPYTIRVDSAFHQSMGDQPIHTIYDIPVTISSPLAQTAAAALTSASGITRPTSSSITSNNSGLAALQQIAKTDEQLMLLVARLNQGKAKHDFFTSLSKDPARFLQRWVQSQKRDLDVIVAKGPWGEEDPLGITAAAGPDLWKSREIAEGVGLMLAKTR